MRRITSETGMSFVVVLLVTAAAASSDSDSGCCSLGPVLEGEPVTKSRWYAGLFTSLSLDNRFSTPRNPRPNFEANSTTKVDDDGDDGRRDE